MLRKILTILNNAPDNIIETRYLAEDNFPFLVKADYSKIIADFKKSFIFKKQVEIQPGCHDLIFMQPETKIGMQVLNYVVGDYSLPQLKEKYDVSITLHNNSRNMLPNCNPGRVMVHAINVIANYILENNLPHFLPYYQFNFHGGLPRDLAVPKGLEIFLKPSAVGFALELLFCTFSMIFCT